MQHPPCVIFWRHRVGQPKGVLGSFWSAGIAFAECNPHLKSKNTHTSEPRCGSEAIERTSNGMRSLRLGSLAGARLLVPNLDRDPHGKRRKGQANQINCCHSFHQ